MASGRTPKEGDMKSGRENSEREEKEQDDDGLILAAGALGALAIGGLTYGVYKLLTHGKEKTRQPAEIAYPPTDSSSSDEEIPEGDVAIRRPTPYARDNTFQCFLEKTMQSLTPYRDVDEKRSLSAEGAISHSNSSDFSSRLLHKYHESYAKITDREMSVAKKVVDDIKEHVLGYVKSNCSDLEITQMRDTGSCHEGLKVICPDEFDVMFTIQLDDSSWQVVCCQGHDAFYEIRKRHTIDQTSPYYRYTTDDFLCPRTVQRYLYGKVQKALNGFQKYFTTLESHGPAITLKVRYDEGRVLYIDFVPSVAIGGILLVPKPHKQVHLHEKTVNEYTRFWRQSFSDEEFDHLTRKLPSWYCHLTVLKIVKAIRLNFMPQFGMFSSYVYKTVLMHMLSDTRQDDWHPTYVKERFEDFLERLRDCLRDHKLQHFFLPGVNLLDEFSPISCSNLGDFIHVRLRKGKLPGLLLTRDYSGIP